MGKADEVFFFIIAVVFCHTNKIEDFIFQMENVYLEPIWQFRMINLRKELLDHIAEVELEKTAPGS